MADARGTTLSLRITGKNKDDLQQAISLLKAQDVEVPLQFENYR